MDNVSEDSETVQVITEGTAPTETLTPPRAPALVPPPAAPYEGAYEGATPALAPVMQPAPPYDAAFPGQAFVEPAPARRNLLALLGVIFAVPIWPAGLVLSTLGLFNAVNRRTGKVLAVIGLALSIVTGVAVVAAVSAAKSTVASSTALDPGCAAIEASLTTDLATLKSDTVTLQANEDSSPSATTTIGTVQTDLTAIQQDLTTADGDVTHAEVKKDLDTMNKQIQPVETALNDIVSHSTSSEGAAAAAVTTLQTTDAHLDALCAAY